jgi:3-phenylpropionate/trans-cinnamate dioxygenase ferredoxin reductase subunit
VVRRIVVIGGGLAGYQSAVAIRRNGFDGRLTVVGDEAHRPYDRPPLSKELLQGIIEPERCFYPCDELGIEWVLGDGATDLAVNERYVRLASGEDVPFDGLVIATGRRARQWHTPPELEGIHTLRSLDDSLALREAAQPGCRVTILGAGFIGCEVAATLRERGVESVVLIEIAAHPMPGLGSEIGRRAARIHAARGVRLKMNASVAAFEGRHRVEAVRLTDGERVEADLVLLALGSIPNSDWLRDSGLELFKGTVGCDKHCFVIGTCNVVAAGDIAAFPHPHADGLTWVEHWTNAREMGTVAGANLLAPPRERKRFAPVPTFWSDQYDVKIKSAGLITHANRFTVVHDDSQSASLVVEAHRADVLIGAVGLNQNRTIAGYQRRLAEAHAG